MKPLESFQGKYFGAGRFLQFNWDAKAIGTDSFIMIAGLVGNGSSLKIGFRKVYKIQTLPGQGNTVKLENIAGVFGATGVQKIVFCGLSAANSAEFSDDAVFEFCRENPDKLAQVMIGEAHVVWKAKTKVQESVKIVELELNSTSNVSQGVIGYQYSMGNKLQVRLPFPGNITPGKKVYPAILIPKECEIEVVAYDSQFSGNLFIKKKTGLFS